MNGSQATPILPEVTKMSKKSTKTAATTSAAAAQHHQ
jgi:hypothetical protein